MKQKVLDQEVRKSVKAKAEEEEEEEEEEQD